MRLVLRICGILAGLAALTATGHAGEITTGSLLREMIDMQALAEFPQPAYHTVQFSSYDHRSRLPGGKDWFANADGFGGDPVPNFEAVIEKPGPDGTGRYLICDVEGPGAIVRCWTAAIAGRIEVSLDDSPKPLFAGSADDFLRHPYDVFAEKAGIDPAVLEDTFNQQNASYCPIPFAGRCRIEWIGKIKEIHFYQIQVRLYQDSAQVVTFQPEQLMAERETIEQVAALLAAPSKQFSYATPEGAARPLVATIEPHHSAELLHLQNGPAALERLTLRLRAPDLESALRQTVLNIACDDQRWGEIQAPIGDFFGAAPGINPFDSVPFTVERDGTMTCRFVMPYAESLRIAIENRGDQAVLLSGSALPMPYQWTERTMYFRARWRVDHELTADPARVRDIPFLLARGRGRYVGTAIFLLNPTDVPTPAGGWWGEGDEKVFIDGEKTPSTFGTGSEDYFDYAWSIPDLFGFAYCGQPRNDGPGNRGFVTNHRWQILDDLPFQNAIAFYMELYSHRRTPGFSYARIGYHYGRPGMIDDHLPITDADLRPLDLPPDWHPVAAGGARGSLFYEPEALLEEAEAANITYTEGNLFSSGWLMTWRPTAVGESLAFSVPVAEEGTYTLGLCAARTERSGALELSLGRPDGSGGWSEEQIATADLKAAAGLRLRRIEGKHLDLKPGPYRLIVRALDGPGCEEGIDFLWLQRR